MIKTVIRVKYNMVIVFDERGRQMPEYQGQYEDVKMKIITDTQFEARFFHWFGISPEPHIVDKINW